MTIVTVQFNYPPEMHRPDYDILLKVFEASVKTHAPNIRFEKILIEPPMLNDGDTHALNFLYNTVKLEKWVEALNAINDDIIFADCDMLMLRGFPEESIWGSSDWDVAYTERTEKRVRQDSLTRKYWGDGPIHRMPMNGGIMMARPTKAAKDFYQQLLDVNNYLYGHKQEHTKWNIKYAGMNQAAFGYLIETRQFNALVKPLPCRIWNAVDSDWHAISGDTIFVHIKSRLRRLVLSGALPYGKFKSAMEAWYTQKRVL